MDVIERLRAVKLVPIITLDDPEKADGVGEAILAGGLACAEVTFRTAAGVEAVARLSKAFPDLLLGAGTVLTPEQVDAAADAGAHFVLAPGFNPRVVDRALEKGLTPFPGVATPTDIEAALEKGLTVLKLFPADPLGGIPYLKALAGPYRAAEFIPTGGVSAGNLASWLALPQVVACGGSWLTPSAAIRDGDFDEIRRRVAEAVEIAGTE